MKAKKKNKWLRFLLSASEQMTLSFIHVLYVHTNEAPFSEI